MNRRRFLRAATTGVAAFAVGNRFTRAASSATDVAPSRDARLPRKPNLLFILTDQQRWDTLACYGSRTIHAPALNALAAQSVVFDRAFVSHPVCTPSRGTLMSGLWPHQSGVTANNIPLPSSTRCYNQLLADPDYRTGYIGKWHLGDELFAQHGFDEWIATEDEYQALFSAGRDKNAKSDYWQFLAGHGQKPDKKNGYFSRTFAVRAPIALGKPAFQAARAVDFLQRHRDEPFILQVSYLEPHTPYQSPLHDLYADDDIPLCKSYYKDSPDDDIPWRIRLRQMSFARSKTFSKPPAQLADITRHYYGNISCVDRSVDTILRELERLGLADHTIVVFTSDHGDQMSAHRLWYKEVMYQESLRVPLLMRVPGVRGGARIDAPWSHIDMVPTLLGLLDADKKIPPHLSGRDRSAEIRGASIPPTSVFAEWSPNDRDDDGEPGKKRRTKKDVYAANYPHLAKYVDESSRTVITPDGWRLTLSDIDKCQLFNLRDDPTEQHNLYYRASHRDTVKRLTAEIAMWQQYTGDSLSKALKF